MWWTLAGVGLLLVLYAAVNLWVSWAEQKRPWREDVRR